MYCHVCALLAPFPDHKWGHIRAWNAGWYHQNDGTWYCPDDRPPWAKPLDISRPGPVQS